MQFLIRDSCFSFICSIFSLCCSTNFNFDLSVSVLYSANVFSCSMIFLLKPSTFSSNSSF
eukprot:UN03211